MKVFTRGNCLGRHGSHDSAITKPLRRSLQRPGKVATFYTQAAQVTMPASGHFQSSQERNVSISQSPAEDFPWAGQIFTSACLA